MRSKIFTKKRVIIWVILFVSLVFLSRIACSEERENFKPRFSIKLTGGWGYMAVGDINRSLESFNDNRIFETARLDTPEFISGEIIKLDNRIPDWEAELRMYVGPKIALSFATSAPIRRKNESSLTYTYRGWGGDQVHTFTLKPEIKAWMPLRLGIVYSLFYGSKINVNFNVGIGYYIAKVSEYRSLDLITPPGDIISETRYWKASTIEGSGFLIGIGMEYNLTKNLALVVEVQGKYAKLRNLKGTMQGENNFGDGYIFNYEQKGILYYFSGLDDHIGAGYYDLEVWEKLSKGSIRLISNARKAVLDLSGFSLRIGIRIKLF